MESFHIFWGHTVLAQFVAQPRPLEFTFFVDFIISNDPLALKTNIQGNWVAAKT